MPDTPPRLTRQIAFLAECDRLKDVQRQTLNSTSRRRENDAEHSWALCLFAITLAEHADADVDLLRVIQMLVIHDLVEIDAGDTFIYDDAARRGQAAREARAAERIFGLLPEDQGRRLRALWEEFEARESADARFAAALDRLQPLLLNCLTEGAAWRRHGVTRDRVLARNAHIARGSETLWAHAQVRVAAAVAAGHLPDDTPDGQG